MCPPGDGGQQGRAHSRQLINPIFPGLPHSWGGLFKSSFSPSKCHAGLRQPWCHSSGGHTGPQRGNKTFSQASCFCGRCVLRPQYPQLRNEELGLWRPVWVHGSVFSECLGSGTEAVGWGCWSSGLCFKRMNEQVNEGWGSSFSLEHKVIRVLVVPVNPLQSLFFLSTGFTF